MGRTITPTFRLEMRRVYCVTTGRYVRLTDCGWKTRVSGSPSNPFNLDAYIRSFEDSTLPGGVNAHLGIIRVGRAQIVRQSNDEVVSTYEPAAFQVL